VAGVWERVWNDRECACKPPRSGARRDAAPQAQKACRRQALLGPITDGGGAACAPAPRSPAARRTEAEARKRLSFKRAPSARPQREPGQRERGAEAHGEGARAVGTGAPNGGRTLVDIESHCGSRIPAA